MTTGSFLLECTYARGSEIFFGNAGSQQESLGAFVVNMVKQEGVGSLWKGFTNNFARIGPLLSSLLLLRF